MTGQNTPRTRTLAKTRPRILLASAAGIGLGVLIAGSGPPGSGLGLSLISNSAQADTPTAARPDGFAEVVAKVKPAVISVRVTMQASERQADTDGTNDENNPLEKFFRQFGQQNRSQVRPVRAEGSGFFVSPDGYAVTNNHVVEQASALKVITDDGKTLDAKVIGSDPKTDLALIKVEGSNFAHVQFADHPPRIGDWVIPVGNPFGLGGTVTAGIISAEGRDIGEGPYNDFLQIDAPVNRGNSGGPAFDINGNVIGVTTAIFSPSGGSVGIGFAIPARDARRVVEQLKDHGTVTRGWLGVQVQAVTPEIADSLDLQQARGALVDQPQAGSPAAKAGIKAGDVITAFNGEEVKDSRDLAQKTSLSAPGSSARLTLLRQGEQQSIDVTLAQASEQPKAKAASDSGNKPPPSPHFGLTMAPASQVAGAGERGVAIVEVDPNGPAAERGLRPGDVILDVAGKSVMSPAEVSKALNDARSQGRRAVLVQVKSGDAVKFIALPFGAA
jgi:serine protease Do